MTRSVNERLARIEKAVFGKVQSAEDSLGDKGTGPDGWPDIPDYIRNPDDDSTATKFMDRDKTSHDIALGLQRWVHQMNPHDAWIVQAVFPPGENIQLKGHPPVLQDEASFHVTRLETLACEERDEDVARLCNALSSRQRVGIMRLLCSRALSSGELVEMTGMAGGHLHHHLRDLLALDLLTKDSDGRYVSTAEGLQTYLTVSALQRRTSMGSRGRL